MPNVEGINIKYEYARDPRFSKQQDNAIMATGARPGSRLLGLDDKHRPVVRAEAGIPLTVQTWAILRNGDPTDPGEITEPWYGMDAYTRAPYI